MIAAAGGAAGGPNRREWEETVDDDDDEDYDDGSFSGMKRGPTAKHCKQCPHDEHPDNLKGVAKLRSVIHLTMEVPDYSITARIVSLSVILLISVSTVSFALETVPELEAMHLWETVEAVVVVIFTIEYVLRLISCRSPCGFLFDGMNMIDLFAVLPFYVELVAGSELVSAFAVFRVIRLARVFRVFKLSRYSTYMRIMMLALKQSADAFGLLLFFIAIAVIIFSSLMYYAERDVPRRGQPSPFTSIPATFYWSIVTMTTVGYGDQFPVTGIGKVVASCTMLAGILIIALPITILGSNFQDVYAVHKKLKVAHKINHESAQSLRDHVEAIRRHRVQLDKILKQLRFLLQSRSEDSDFFQIWTTVDYVVINGLLRIEQFLCRVELLSPNNGGLGGGGMTNKVRGTRNSVSTLLAGLQGFANAKEEGKLSLVGEEESGDATVPLVRRSALSAERSSASMSVRTGVSATMPGDVVNPLETVQSKPFLE